MPHLHPHYHYRHPQKWALVIILLVAAFFRFYHLNSIPPGLYPDEAVNSTATLQAISHHSWQVFYPQNNDQEGPYINAIIFKLFGADIWTMRLGASLTGILGVIALYLLAKEWFNWPIAALSSFLMAVSFWHVNFSRISFRAVWAPTLFTFCLYFLWKGLRGKHFYNFLFSGIFLGLGLYTHQVFLITPLILVLGIWAYASFLKKDFSGEKYQEAHRWLWRGLVLITVTTILVALPLGLYFWLNPANFFGQTGQISIFQDAQSLKTLAINTVKTLGMFNFVGDFNWRHNFSGAPLLFWPIGVFFVAGFFRMILKLFKHLRKHGHFSTIPVVILGWFFLGLSPIIFSNETIPHALQAMVVAPMVFLLAGEGLWWFFECLRRWYSLQDQHPHEAAAVTFLVLMVFLASLALAQYQAYFLDWANNPEGWTAQKDLLLKNPQAKVFFLK